MSDSPWRMFNRRSLGAVAALAALVLAGLGLGLRYESGGSFPTVEVRRAPLTI